MIINDDSNLNLNYEQKIVFSPGLSEVRGGDSVGVVSKSVLGSKGVAVPRRLEIHDIESVGGDLGKRINYYEWFSPRGASSSVFSFIKDVSVKVANYLQLDKSSFTKAATSRRTPNLSLLCYDSLCGDSCFTILFRVCSARFMIRSWSGGAS